MVPQELEQTLILIKPDALKASLTGYILSQFSEFHTGLRFAGAKIVHMSRALAEEHYSEHRGKPFFASLIEYITGRIHYPSEPHKRRVIALVFCGPDAVKKLRAIAGLTNPHDARDRAPGTIRALGTIVVLKDASGKVVGERLDNLVHASASDLEAEREIKLWFQPTDIMPYMRDYATEPCDADYYFKDGASSEASEAGSRCLLAAGATVWKSDLEALQAHRRGAATDTTLNAVIAKYVMNEQREGD